MIMATLPARPTFNGHFQPKNARKRSFTIFMTVSFFIYSGRYVTFIIIMNNNMSICIFVHYVKNVRT
ncbi:hypothetical protein ccbrp13_31040 [Ktedonobacteria bacterium brp13]|nr:hypothetical protein ccbrp13_31040 [Ktedonobacteria bacterium brp13]